MAVRSQPTNPRVSQDRPQLVPRGCVVGATINLLRIIACVLIIASTWGNYIVFVGGWGAWYPIDWMAMVWAAVYQALCSVFQWGFKALRWWMLYLVALIASAIPSFLTYNAWLGPYLAVQIGPVVAMIVIGLATLGADALPEWVLVE